VANGEAASRAVGRIYLVDKPGEEEAAVMLAEPGVALEVGFRTQCTPFLTHFKPYYLPRPVLGAADGNRQRRVRWCSGSGCPRVGHSG
jgi:hypothetical protein